MTTSQVMCPCGALYERTEFNAAPREADSFVCSICGETLEHFDEAGARLIGSFLARSGTANS
jgi:transcription initiation factor IIE alpha subunit